MTIPTLTIEFAAERLTRALNWGGATFRVEARADRLVVTGEGPGLDWGLVPERWAGYRVEVGGGAP